MKKRKSDNFLPGDEEEVDGRGAKSFAGENGWSTIINSILSSLTHTQSQTVTIWELSMATTAFALFSTSRKKYTFSMTSSVAITSCSYSHLF